MELARTLSLGRTARFQQKSSSLSGKESRQDWVQSGCGPTQKVRAPEGVWKKAKGQVARAGVVLFSYSTCYRQVTNVDYTGAFQPLTSFQWLLFQLFLILRYLNLMESCSISRESFCVCLPLPSGKLASYVTTWLLQKPKGFRWNHTPAHESTPLIQTPLWASVSHEMCMLSLLKSVMVLSWPTHPWRVSHLTGRQWAHMTLCNVRMKCFILVGTSSKDAMSALIHQNSKEMDSLLDPASNFAHVVGVMDAWHTLWL